MTPEPFRATDRFELTVGVNPGYHHANQEDDPVAKVAQAWGEEAESTLHQTGVYVPGVIALSKTVYRREWGCPPGGEDVAIVVGVRNPELVPEEQREAWLASVQRVAARVAARLGQKAAYLSFSRVEFVALKPLS